MSLGIAMMVHVSLRRAAQVARYWAEHGCPVAIHVDARVPAGDFATLKNSLADFNTVVFSARRRVEWGTWSVVRATQAVSALALERFPEIGHLYLSSGSCLPLRPPAELRAYLARHTRTDFIESVTTSDVPWTVDGLEQERFQFRFPFGWKRHRRLFDAYVRLQRRLHVRRSIPDGVVPHLGSQWWCLSRETLSAILQSPDRARHDRYFSRVWIPDESYFQSLTRLYSPHIESRSLTLSKFDFQGKPHVFYDDHLQLLRRSDCFVARKIWPHAEGLYQAFLRPDADPREGADPTPGKIDRLFSKASERRIHGRPGLLSAGRFPRPGFERRRTSAPYSVFSGFNDLFEEFVPWLEKRAIGRVHGHLFDPARAQFAARETVFNGSLSDSAALRDQAPESFLTSLIWNARHEHQSFQFGPGDVQAIMPFMAHDMNARIAIITGAWALRLYRSGKSPAAIRKAAARLQAAELEYLRILRAPWVSARVRIWSLAEFTENPIEHLQLVTDELAGHRRQLISEIPPMVPLEGFTVFLQQLKNQGILLPQVGDLLMAGKTFQSPRPLGVHEISR